MERFADKPEPDQYAAWDQSASDVTRKDHFSVLLRPDGGFAARITKK